MGIMILPLVSSLSEDAMSAVPRGLREGAYALGATKFEVATRVVVPAALSGIVAAFILAISRAVGETMIVAIAAGQSPNLTLNPLVPMETMTAYIVQVSLGDTPYGTLEYRTIFAVGMTLFVMTLVLNIFASGCCEVPGGVRMSASSRCAPTARACPARRSRGPDLPRPCASRAIAIGILTLAVLLR